jgi:hypothetical protein
VDASPLSRFERGGIYGRVLADSILAKRSVDPADSSAPWAEL